MSGLENPRPPEDLTCEKIEETARCLISGGSATVERVRRGRSAEWIDRRGG